MAKTCWYSTANGQTCRRWTGIDRIGNNTLVHARLVLLYVHQDQSAIYSSKKSSKKYTKYTALKWGEASLRSRKFGACLKIICINIIKNESVTLLDKASATKTRNLVNVICFFIYSFIHSFTLSFIHSLIRWVIHSLITSFILYCFLMLFVHSFCNYFFTSFLLFNSFFSWFLLQLQKIINHQCIIACSLQWHLLVNSITK